MRPRPPPTLALDRRRLFSADTDYKKLDAFESAASPRAPSTAPTRRAASFLPDDPIGRIRHKIKTTLQLQHPPHYAIVQVQPVVPAGDPARRGAAPPIADPDAPVVSVVMVRDLGSDRVIPLLYLVISLGRCSSSSPGCCTTGTRRSTKNREAAAATTEV